MRDEHNNAITLNRYDAILFDFDGVIADSEPMHLKTKKYALDTFNIPYNDDILLSFQGCPEKAFFDFFADKYNMPTEALLLVKRQHYAQNLPLIAPIKGVIDFMQKCSQYKHVSIVTSSIRKDVDDFIKRNAIETFIKDIVSCEDVINHKPDPEPYMISIQRNGLISHRCLVIEDSINGIRSAKAAKCRVVGLLGQFNEQELLSAGADFVVQNYEELNQKIIWSS